MRPVHNRREDDLDHEVPWEEVVKGYEYEPGQYVIITEDELRAANVEATQSIDLIHFVDDAEIDPTYYSTPYYTEPSKAGRKAYALLRETLRRTGRVGVAKVVIRTRQHLCALRAAGPMLLIEILRWPYQLRSPADFNLPAEDLGTLGVSEAELAMAEQLVGSMVAAWDPAQYTDTYHDDVLRLVEDKVKHGSVTTVSAEPPAETAPAEGAVVDIMSLLKRSVERRKQTSGAAGPGRRTG
jgi:DNA end-binding protein Ku